MSNIGSPVPNNTKNAGPTGGYIGDARVNFSLSAGAVGKVVTANVTDTNADGVRIDLDNKNSATYVQLQKIEVESNAGNWTTVWTGNLLLSTSWETFSFTTRNVSTFRFTFDEGNSTGDASIDMDVQPHEVTTAQHNHPI